MADTGKIDSIILKQKLATASPQFKRKIAYITVNGSKEEKEKLKENIKEVIDEEKKLKRRLILKKIKTRGFNVTRIREMLKKKQALSSILESIY
jgi:hypothetical protein